MNDTTDRQLVVQQPLDALARMTLCKELAGARLVPAAFQRSPADIWLAMSTCDRLDLDFFLCLPEMSVIKGRLFFGGKLCAAILNRRLADHLTYEYSGAGDKRMVKVRARKQNEAEPREIELTVGEAKTENTAWKTQPDQQLAYRGATVWGRRHAPEIMLGILFEGDVIDVTPTTVRVHDPVTGEVVEETEKPPEIAKPEPISSAKPVTITMKEGEDWRPWGAKLIAYVRACVDVDMVDRWIDANTSPLDLMMKAEPKLYGTLERAIQAHKDTLPAREPQQ